MKSLNTLSAGSPSNNVNPKKKHPPVTRNIAVLGMLLLLGSGMYFGLIFVFLRSAPIIDVPLGNITPPSAELNICKTFAGS